MKASDFLDATDEENSTPKLSAEDFLDSEPTPRFDTSKIDNTDLFNSQEMQDAIRLANTPNSDSLKSSDIINKLLMPATIPDESDAALRARVGDKQFEEIQSENPFIAAPKLVGEAAAGVGNLPARGYRALPENVKPYAKPILQLFTSKAYSDKAANENQGVIKRDENGKEILTSEKTPLPYEAGKPLVAFDRQEANPELNHWKDIIEGLTTPEMVATIPFAAAKPVQIYFLSQTAPAAIEAATKLISKDVPANERSDAATDLLLNGIFSYGLVRGLIKDNNLQLKPKPQLQGAPAIGSILKTPEGALPETFPDIESTIGKTGQGIPSKGVAEQDLQKAILENLPPKATVPSTESEPYETAIGQIRRTQSKTKNQIKALFPLAELTNEQAAELRNQAWGKNPVESPAATIPNKPISDEQSKLESLQSTVGLNKSQTERLNQLQTESGNVEPDANLDIRTMSKLKPQPQVVKEPIKTPPSEPQAQETAIPSEVKPIKWDRAEGNKNSAPISYSGDYVISERPDLFTLSFRPAGQHIPLGQFETLNEAKSAAEEHFSESIHGGSQESLSPEQQAISKQNNSREAFEVLAKKEGTSLPETPKSEVQITKAQRVHKYYRTLAKEEFPSMPDATADSLASYLAETKGVMQSDEMSSNQAIRLAVLAFIRHNKTPYESNFQDGLERGNNRAIVRNQIDKIYNAWKTGYVEPKLEKLPEPPKASSEQIALERQLSAHNKETKNRKSQGLIGEDEARKQSRWTIQEKIRQLKESPQKPITQLLSVKRDAEPTIESVTPLDIQSGNPIKVQKSSAGKTPAIKPEQSPEQVLESTENVKVTLPKGATMLRVSTESGGKKYAPKIISKVELEKGNVFKESGVTKVEAGTMSGKEFIPMKEKPKFIGMGGAIPEEFERGQGNPTANKYKLIDQERQARGLEPLTKSSSVSDQAVMDRAMSEIDKDPSLPDKLVAELNSTPRTIEDWENHVLLLRKIDLRDEYEKSAREAAQAYEDSQEYPDRKADMIAANIRTAEISDKLTELERASRLSGSARGRALRSLQIMANEDYSLASLETQLRASKGGKPLTDDERAGLVKIADDYKKANEELQKHLAEVTAKNSTLEANKAIAEIQRTEQPIDPYVKSLADRIIAALDTQANAALNRIRQRRAEGRIMSGLDPVDLADHAIFGASKLAKGFVKFSDWSADMVKDLGEYVTPHLKKIFAESNKVLDKHISKLTSPVNKKRVELVIKQKNTEPLKEGIKTKIAEKIASGKNDGITALVQKLARYLVQEGIKDRDQLIDSVHKFLQEIDPEITRRDAMDAISGYGDFKQLKKDEISVRLRGMNGEMQQIAKLEDMANGVPPSKTGVERREPTEAERKLIKAVNESKIKFQVPITDPATQLKSALDIRKIQLQNQIKEMEEKISSNDFSKTPRQPLNLDRKAQELQAKKERVIKTFKLKQRQFELANRTKTEKVFDFISNARRFSVLSGVNVLAKLAAYSATKVPTMALTDIIGGGLSKLPYLKKIAAGAPSEGSLRVKALTRAVSKGLTQGFVDAYKTATTGQSDLRAAFSSRIESGREWYNFFQTIHEVIKSPLRRTAFELALEKRMEFAAKNGADITDPMTQLALSKDAYLDSDRALLLENNRLAGGIRSLFKQLEQKNKKTGEVPLYGKMGATLGRVELPILNVPLNYAKQTLMSAFGLISGSEKARAAFKRGLDKTSPEEKDQILRHLKYGTVGGAMLLYGFYDGYNNGSNGTFGGYYQPNEKRKPEQAGVGGLKIGEHKISGLLLHNPVLAVGQLGHTIGAIAASKQRKSDTETRGIPAGTVAGLMGLLNESPLGRQVEVISQLSDPRSADYALGEHIKGLAVPQLVQEAANFTDKDTQGNLIKRDPRTIIQHVETGIPVLRKTVPEKKK